MPGLPGVSEITEWMAAGRGRWPAGSAVAADVTGEKPR